MEKIEAFKASDGSLWESKDKAERQELFLQKDMIVEEIWYVINAIPSPWGFDNSILLLSKIAIILRIISNY